LSAINPVQEKLNRAG